MADERELNQQSPEHGGDDDDQYDESKDISRSTASAFLNPLNVGTKSLSVMKNMAQSSINVAQSSINVSKDAMGSLKSMTTMTKKKTPEEIQ